MKVVVSSYEMGNPYIILVGRPEEKKLIARPGLRKLIKK
jgi:hypothetical protein